MGKKLITEQNFFEKLVMALLKGRFFKIANELKKDPELLNATKDFNTAVQNYKNAVEKFKEKHGEDLSKL
jgi:hypothetical protein